ncbi:hypothetical protein [Burkholderia multivorans]|uniref:hypothetical protein n=1 Tax=Burkholderia multivorans TaxID=87883 RepID=UPI00143E13DC|nr:hypothetical protein [Burkholderia multivorans]QIX18340.1 hypothetical protein FOB32_22715 [Burkholderia multivorans]
MTDIAEWPATLPGPRASGYGLQPKARFGSTELDSGRTRNRRRSTNAPTSVTVKWRFTHAQMATFEAFVEYEINAGAAPFSVDLVNGMGVTPVQAMFTGDPPYQPAISDSRAWFDVTATLQVKRMPVVSFDVYEVLKQYTEQEIDAMSDPLHTFLHVQLPGPLRWD